MKMNKYILEGIAQDQETIFRLRPWMEEEVRKEVGEPFQYTQLQIDYDAPRDRFNFVLSFRNQPFDIKGKKVK